ncbi:hypothetical protein E9549_01345 [Blastococcus sp. MG754426]|uniref:hypothetical protein n=1 Tax=unclassified Blastococcus TaxID=2619396 RepID=UPI001EF138C3|nr:MULTISPECIES: hypothetical protein [unclassified Blastococcus]MCF6506062.1 hypothetical protein [Blastococcus sp. MG754426]MCF6510552.1 hypothetical protein [Blastococcus sp. MG754427]
MTAATPETRRPAGRPVLFWFGVGGGTSAWLLHLLAGYWAVEVACPTESPVLPAYLVGLTVLLAGAAVAASWASWWAMRHLPPQPESAAVPGPEPRPLLPWRRRRDPEEAPPAGAWDPVPSPARNRMLALTGLTMNLLAVGLIVLALPPVLAYGPCW